MSMESVTAESIVKSYVACARLEDQPIDWAEINDAICYEGYTSPEADAAIRKYRDAHGLW